MKKHEKLVCASVLILILGLAMNQALKSLSFYKVENVSIVGANTVSVSEIANRSLFESYYSINYGKMIDAIKGLGYVDNVSISFDDGTLTLLLDAPENAVILTSGENSFLYDGESMRKLLSRDVESLSESYLKVEVDDDYLLYLERYGATDVFTGLVGALFELGDYSALISKAEFSNNNTIGSGKLTLYLDSLNSELSVSDFQNADRIKDSLKAIEREFSKNPIKALNSSFSEYELRMSDLVRIKR